MKDSLHQVCLAIRQGECLTVTQITRLIVFGAKPKTLNIFLPKDKRRISRLNSDFKLVSGWEAEGFKKTFNYTLSPVQLLADTDTVQPLWNKQGERLHQYCVWVQVRICSSGLGLHSSFCLHCVHVQGCQHVHQHHSCSQ